MVQGIYVKLVTKTFPFEMVHSHCVTPEVGRAERIMTYSRHIYLECGWGASLIQQLLQEGQN